MRRFVYIGMAGLFVAALVLSGCQQKVTVEAGEKVVCQYGDVISNTVAPIEVPADKASAYTVEEKVGLCERHERLLRMYAEAQAALKVGDTKTAKKKLEAVVSGDPKFEKASAQLTEIAAGKTPAPDPSVTGGSSAAKPGTKPSKKPGTPAEPQPVGPVVSLQRWVPQTLAGFKTGTVSPDVLSISREYISEKSSPEAVVISAEQFSSKATAASALEQTMGAYSKDRATEKIAGRSSSFGTDGRQYAAVGFSDGPILVVIEAHASKAGDPAAMFATLREIAGSLPTK